MSAVTDRALPLDDEARRVIRRYYLAMSLIFVVDTVISFIFCWIYDAFRLFALNLAVDVVVLLGVNLYGASRIFKPVRAFIASGENFTGIERTLTQLPLRSAYWGRHPVHGDHERAVDPAAHPGRHRLGGAAGDLGRHCLDHRRADGAGLRADLLHRQRLSRGSVPLPVPPTRREPQPVLRQLRPEDRRGAGLLRDRAAAADRRRDVELHRRPAGAGDPHRPAGRRLRAADRAVLGVAHADQSVAPPRSGHGEGRRRRSHGAPAGDVERGSRRADRALQPDGRGPARARQAAGDLR